MASAIPFSEFVDRALYDPQFGYYGAGVVRFGDESHYSTYPQRLSPGFGWMLADAVAWLLDAPVRDGRIPRDVPITILEIGAGDGALATDTLDRLEAMADDPWLGPLAARVQYVVGDRSPALRARQQRRLARHIAAGRARSVALDARRPAWDGPFYGVVVCNELLSNLTCEKVRVLAPGRYARVGVAPRDALSPEALWESVARGESPTLDEVTLPLSADAELARHLDAAAPLLADLHALGACPFDFPYGAGVPAFLDGVAGILTGPDRYGVALLVDYGGTTRHVLDPRVPHIRTYGDGTGRSPLETPGRLDITWDVDFTHLGSLCPSRGIALHHFGHQSALESARADLWGPGLRERLVAGRVAEGAAPGAEAEAEAERLVFEFREADGFRTAIVGPPGYEVPAVRFGPSDAWAHEALVTVSPRAAADDLARALEGIELPPVDTWLYPGCDPVANLSRVEAYHARAAVLSRLAPYLRGPGELARGR